MKKVRLGLVGCGKRGIYVTRLFKTHPNCEVTALMDRFGACTAQAAETLDLPDAKHYTDYDLMLREAPVDAVFFACDPTVQVEMACRAMELGKHVCTDVPAAFTIEDCWKLIETVEKTGCKYQLMEQTRYWGFIDGWKQMYDRGDLGHVCMAQGEYVHYEQWGNWIDTETGEIIKADEPPAGRKVEQHWRHKLLADPICYLPHTLSPLLKILSDRVVRVSCMGTRKGSYTSGHEQLPWSDIQYALMHTEKDTLLVVGAGFSMPSVDRGPLSAHWYELRGSGGTVTSPRSKDEGFRLWRRGMETFEGTDLSSTPLNADAEQAKSGHGGADFKPVDTFIQAVLNDTTPPMDVYLTAEMTAPPILAVASAALGGAPLDVPDFRQPRSGK